MAPGLRSPVVAWRRSSSHGIRIHHNDRPAGWPPDGAPRGLARRAAGSRLHLGRGLRVALHRGVPGFVVYPISYGLWLSSDPARYRALLDDPVYPRAVVNTLIYLAVGVNLKLFLALLLSGFFMRRDWWVRVLLLIFILPWAVPGIPTFISFHWMLNGKWG